MRGIIVALAGIAALCACGSDGKPRPMRQISTSYYYEIAPDEAPPHARQSVTYKVTVSDRKSHQPIEYGEGRLFASDSAGAKTWDGFRYGPEIGTYHAVLSFITPGQWAVAIQFRRDSLHPLERIDWMQDVLNEKPSTIP